MSKALMIIVLIVLCGCKHEPCVRDCVRGHNYTTMMPMWIGKSLIMMPQVHYTCDEYGPPHQNPDSEEKCLE